MTFELVLFAAAVSRYEYEHNNNINGILGFWNEIAQRGIKRVQFISGIEGIYIYNYQYKYASPFLHTKTNNLILRSILQKLHTNILTYIK